MAPAKRKVFERNRRAGVFVLKKRSAFPQRKGDGDSAIRRDGLPAGYRVVGSVGVERVSVKGLRRVPLSQVSRIVKSVIGDEYSVSQLGLVRDEMSLAAIAGTEDWGRIEAAALKIRDQRARGRKTSRASD